VNRLLQESAKPEPTTFHQDTVNFLKRRRNTSNILSTEQPLVRKQPLEENSLQFQMKKIEL